jgi:hypothetical protein
MVSQTCFLPPLVIFQATEVLDKLNRPHLLTVVQSCGLDYFSLAMVILLIHHGQFRNCYQLMLIGNPMKIYVSKYQAMGQKNANYQELHGKHP